MLFPVGDRLLRWSEEHDAGEPVLVWSTDRGWTFRALASLWQG